MSRGQVVSMGDIRGQVVSMCDSRGQVVSMCDSRGQVVSMCDSRGQVVSMCDGRRWVVSMCDSRGQVVSMGDGRRRVPLPATLWPCVSSGGMTRVLSPTDLSTFHSSVSRCSGPIHASWGSSVKASLVTGAAECGHRTLVRRLIQPACSRSGSLVPSLPPPRPVMAPAPDTLLCQ